MKPFVFFRVFAVAAPDLPAAAKPQLQMENLSHGVIGVPTSGSRVYGAAPSMAAQSISSASTR
jgi:hypothetical protein